VDASSLALRRIWCLLLLSLLIPSANLHAQDPDSDLTGRAQSLLARMTVEQKVGQLFLVTFVGSDASPGTDIAKLIRQDYVGGVVLLASNSNFYNDTDTPRQLADLSNALQTLAMDSGAKVPLFIGLDHEGDAYPYTRVTNGTTPLPNAMAIGATWDPANARDVGQIVGRELAAMGVNLLLGPVVDVLNNPLPSGQGDIGTRTFGGDPWWVGQMGRAYIEGVHQGSNGRVATVAKHFPGHGGSDRLPDEEVATVDKSLQELRRIELAPFFAVTRQDSSPEAVTDALMSSHIRYRGFQGNLRQFTAPISFDAEGMGAILGLVEFAGWRPTGASTLTRP
jgi:beta-N-acetylhexosaminidase